MAKLQSSVFYKNDDAGLAACRGRVGGLEPRHADVTLDGQADRTLCFEIGIFKGRLSYETRSASSCQILWRSVSPLHSYRDFFSNFKTAAVRRIYWSFQFFDILTFRRVRTAIVLNFIEIGQVTAEISRFDGFSKMADVRHLGF